MTGCANARAPGMSFVEEIADDIIFLLEGKIYFQGSVNELKEINFEDNFENAIANILKVNNV